MSEEEKKLNNEVRKEISNHDEPVLVNIGYGEVSSRNLTMGVDFAGSFETAGAEKSKSDGRNNSTNSETARSNPWAAALATSAVLAADATVVGVVDDFAIPVILAGAAVYDVTQRTFVTYTMRNAAGQVYVGRTSGFGDPYSIMMSRAANHHMKMFGFGSPLLDRAVQGYQGYPAIRGREQQLIDSLGGINSPNVGNRIRGVSKYNPFGSLYHEASNS